MERAHHHRAAWKHVCMRPTNHEHTPNRNGTHRRFVGSEVGEEDRNEFIRRIRRDLRERSRRMGLAWRGSGCHVEQETHKKEQERGERGKKEVERGISESSACKVK